MLIRLDNLVEDRSYTIEECITPDASIKELVGASIVEDIKVTIHYTWSNEELNVKIKSSYTVDAHCDLCFEATKAACNCEVEESLTEEDSEYLRADNAFDITKIIEECIVLALARTVRCNTNCKGVCPTCGANLNKSSCDCDKQANNTNPFGILKDLIITGGAKNGSTKKKNI